MLHVCTLLADADITYIHGIVLLFVANILRAQTEGCQKDVRFSSFLSRWVFVIRHVIFVV